MRSRYTAYVRRDRDYLLLSWRADFRPPSLVLDESLHWLRLDVLDCNSQGEHASVEFEALFLLDGRVEAMREKSRFVCEQGRWLYTDGDSLPPRHSPRKPGRNESCPCGSGKKFKRCCGR